VPRLDAHGVELHYQTLGNGPDVVMLHGLITGSLASWYYTLAPLVASDHRVTLYDMRGHGLSQKTATGYDSETLCRDLDAVVNQTCSDRFCLVGQSYGALVALRYALKYPDRVSQLILVELPLPPSQAGDLEALLDGGAESVLAALPQNGQHLMGGGGRGRRFRRFCESIRFFADDSTLRHDLDVEPDIDETALASLDVPTLAIYGDQSSCLPTLDRLAAHVTDLKTQTLNGGHYLHLDALEPLSVAVRGFLNG